LTSWAGFASAKERTAGIEKRGAARRALRAATRVASMVAQWRGLRWLGEVEVVVLVKLEVLRFVARRKKLRGFAGRSLPFANPSAIINTCMAFSWT
jgi:hypothetical protein